MLASQVRMIAAIAVLAAVAGFLGAWLGIEYSRRTPPVISPETLIQLIDRSGVQLRPEQHQQVESLARDFQAAQQENSGRFYRATVRVAELLTGHDDERIDETAVADIVAPIVRERYINTVRFVTEVRRVLDAEQREAYDQMVMELFTGAPT